MNEKDIIEILKQKNLVLPSLDESSANYLEYRIAGNLIFISGQTPLPSMGCKHQGRLGDDCTVEEGYLSAQNCALQLIKVLSVALAGDFTKLKQIVKITGMVCSTQDFTKQGAVINGCSDLLCDVFGSEKGKHARFSIGVMSLPAGANVEIEMVAEITNTTNTNETN